MVQDFAFRYSVQLLPVAICRKRFMRIQYAAKRPENNRSLTLSHILLVCMQMSKYSVRRQMWSENMKGGEVVIPLWHSLHPWRFSERVSHSLLFLPLTNLVLAKRPRILPVT